MGYPFPNPVAGDGGALILASLHSPNFLHAVSGWSVGQDGSAEFNSITLRGEFAGTNFVITSAGAFFYDGPPAAGNLIISIAPAAGTDSKGNAFISGIGVYDLVTGDIAQLDAGVLDVTSGTAGGLGRLLWTAASLSGIGGSVRNIAEVTAVDTSTLQTMVDVIAPTGTQSGAVVIFGWQPTGAVMLPVSLVLAAAGSGLAIKEGTGARMGTGTLSGGTVTIANTSVTANTRVFITMRTHGPNSGFVSVAVTPRSGFTVSSSNSSDGNSFNWLLIEAA